ncbi:MAG: hypothetical protein F4170_05050 [Rhodobacteraceae bacterium]|nr:hypothetical protein [Paracoccaceae bacterium]MYJ87981.1 hypothetical protein [Paracoccaceae bacterium]
MRQIVNLPGKNLPRVVQTPKPIPVTIVLDADVLYSYHRRNIILFFFQEGLFRVRWTDIILDE